MAKNINLTKIILDFLPIPCYNIYNVNRRTKMETLIGIVIFAAIAGGILAYAKYKNKSKTPRKVHNTGGGGSGNSEHDVEK